MLSFVYRKLLILTFVCLGILSTVPQLQADSKKNSHTWLEVEIGIIGTASVEILNNAMAQVSKLGYSGLIIKLDTPGGALDATRVMVESILNAPFPTIVWVGPSGARAASAGAFITLAGHIAAMAPGTNIGAATPIEISGKDLDKGDAGRKIENDTRAFMESIADARHRDKEMAVSFVVNALSVTAQEALDHKVIDLITPNVDTLMREINKREITLSDGKKITLDTEGSIVAKYEKNVRHKFLEILSNPNLFYLLFIAGLIGIGFELTHPGVMMPGVIGGICLILALIATSVLPVSFGAMILIVVSIGFMVAEAFLPSFGVLGIGGFIGFIIGSVLLVDPGNEQGLRISLLTIVPGAGVVAGFAALVSYLILRSERARVRSGAEGMVGQPAIALSDFVDGTGRVRVQGEDWKATLQGDGAVKKGDHVAIDAIEGLELRVRRIEAPVSDKGG